VTLWVILFHEWRRRWWWLIREYIQIHSTFLNEYQGNQFEVGVRVIGFFYRDLFIERKKGRKEGRKGKERKNGKTILAVSLLKLFLLPLHLY
jgi:hypothetical protein